MRSAGKAAVVTGAGSGIGRSIAIRLAEDGIAMVAADLNLEAAQSTAEEIGSRGGSALAVRVDVGDVAQLQSMVDAAVHAFGTIDILVACAGVVQTKGVLDITEADWDFIFRVNARGTFFTNQLVARQMVRQGGGTIVNIASDAARGPRPLYIHYAASKTAVLSMTKSMAAALAPHGITVNAICPGIVATPMWDQIDREAAAINNRPIGELRQQRVSQIPLGRIETPEDVAGAVAFLVSRDASYITGQTLNVDGGMEMN